MDEKNNICTRFLSYLLSCRVNTAGTKNPFRNKLTSLSFDKIKLPPGLEIDIFADNVDDLFGGSILVSDDYADVIYRIYYTGS